MKNWLNVFVFTLRKTAGKKGYIITTVMTAILLIAGISGGMLLIEMLADDGGAAGIVRAVTVGDYDMSAADTIGGGMYAYVEYENAADIEEAAAACDRNSVILVVEDGLITAVVPENSKIGVDEAGNFAAYLAGCYPYAQAGESAGEFDLPAYATTVPTDETDVENEELSSIVGMIVPYVVVMLMYFMVLIYGQGIANDAIIEKTSKLMDLFLVSVKPGAMMQGKVLAGAAAGLMQTLIWIFSAVGGCGLGVMLVKHANPNTDMPLVMLFENMEGIGSVLAPDAHIVSALVIISGFLVYCGLAGVGGALASKPEDLGSCNYLFTMALVISFFACLFTGESAGMISDAEWMQYVPFTAVLVMPGRLLTGAASAADGMISAAISVVFAVITCILAGKAYTLTAFYRGIPMNPIKFIKSLKK